MNTNHSGNDVEIVSYNGGVLCRRKC